MCTYNGARYVQQQLSSIHSQTLLPHELIISDDRSDDNTLDLVRSFRVRATFPVRVYSNEERLGATKNFERAIRRCTGDVILLADQDDIWRREKIQRLMAILSVQNGGSFAFSDADLVDEHGLQTGGQLWAAVGFSGSTPQDLFPVLLKTNVATGATMAFFSSLKRAILPIPADWTHDHWIALLGSAFFKGLPVPERLLMYRQHSSQLIGIRNNSLIHSSKISYKANGHECMEKAQRFQDLFNRIVSLGPTLGYPAAHLAMLHDTQQHLLERARIRSQPRRARVLSVAREAGTGRYRQFSRSWKSIARDLCFY